MNFFEFHLGDYAEATGHLTFVEDAAYSRLLRKYYSTEKPIPADIKQAQRLVGARSREEREAVETVLREFFELRDDGWHNNRCDEEIEAYQAGEPEREARRANKDTRLKRHREMRAAMFEALRAVGQAPAWNTKTATLRDMLKSAGIDPETVAAPYQHPLPATRPATAPATPETATQSPLPSPHFPDISNTASTDVLARPRPSAEDPGQPPLEGVEPPQQPKPKTPPDCPHQAVLALWAEVLPQLPQHSPAMWRGARADHLRARWRETAALKGWPTEAEGLAYFRRLFGYVGQSRFLTGRAPSSDPNKPPFVVELAWLVCPENWAKVHEGKYHPEAA